MSIYRTSKNAENPYVMLDKRFLEDDRLTWRAKGILSYLLSKPDSWQTRESDLVKRSKEGREAVRSAMKELENCGYMQREQRRTDKGAFAQNFFAIYEMPQAGEPLTGSPLTGNPSTVNTTHSNNDSTKNDFSKNEESKAAIAAPPPKVIEAEIVPTLEALPTSLAKHAESDFLGVCFDIYRQEKAPVWADHESLPDTSKTHLRKAAKRQKGWRQGAELFRDALRRMRADESFFGVTSLTLVNLGSKDKFITEGDAYRSSGGTLNRTNAKALSRFERAHGARAHD